MNGLKFIKTLKHIIWTEIAIFALNYSCFTQDTLHFTDTTNEYYKALKMVVKDIDSNRSLFNDSELKKYVINVEASDLIVKKIPSQVGRYKIHIIDRQALRGRTKNKGSLFLNVIYSMEFKNGLFLIKTSHFDVTQWKTDKYLYGKRGGLNVWFQFNCSSGKLEFLRSEYTDQ